MAIKTYNDQNFVAIANAIRSKSKNPTTYKPSEMAAAISAIESGFELLPQDTVSGAIANFPDGSDGYPVVELIANIEPKQTGSGDPAPDNVRAISGFTGMRISKNGKNFFDNALFPKTITDTNYYAQFQSNVGIDNPLYMPEIRIIPGIPYTLSFDITCSVEPFNVSIGIGDGRYLRDLTTKSNQASGRVFVTFTLTAEIAAQYGNILSLRMPRFGTQTTFTATISNIQVEIGSSNTDYEPYAAPEVKTISFGEVGTVYLGSLNVTTGVLTVIGLMITLPSEGWTYYTTGGKNTFNMIIAGAAYGESGYCERYKFQNVSYISAQPDKSFYFYKVTDSVTRISICDNDYSNASTFGEAVSGTKLVYTLKTPATYQLTPEEVKTLLGVNNIYSDTGNVSVTYRADVDLYIAKKIAEGA